jgi:hypothetical protein
MLNLIVFQLFIFVVEVISNFGGLFKKISRDIEVILVVFKQARYFFQIFPFLIKAFNIFFGFFKKDLIFEFNHKLGLLIIEVIFNELG